MTFVLYLASVFAVAAASILPWTVGMARPRSTVANEEQTGEQGWGRVRDGFQVRLAVEDGRRSFYFGESVRLGLTLRNAVAEPVSLRIATHED